MSRHSECRTSDRERDFAGCFIFVLMATMFFLGCLILKVEEQRPEMVTVVIRETEFELQEATNAAATDEIADRTGLDIPLTAECIAVLEETCESNGVPIALALGLIQTESRFRHDAVSSSGCYGLCQLNPRYFPSGLSPEENIRHGIDYLGQQLRRYGNVERALTAYNAGHDNGTRTYAATVLYNATAWGWSE